MGNLNANIILYVLGFLSYAANSDDLSFESFLVNEVILKFVHNALYINAGF